MANLGTLVVHLGLDDTALKKGEKSAKSSFSNIEKYAAAAAAAVGGLFIGFNIASVATDVIKTADTMKLLEGRLKLVSKSEKEYANTQKELFDIANDTRVAYESTVSLYTRMARAARNTSVSQQEMLQVTESINKAIIVSGAEASSANAALIQLSQGLGANALRGEEMNSVLEQIPRVAQLIADGLEVTTDQLREMGSAGALNSKKVIDAILSQKDAIDREFAAMPKTVGQSVTVMNNHVQRFIGEFDKVSGVTLGIADGISDIADAIGEIDSSEIETLAKTMEVIASTASRGIKIIGAYYALLYGPAVIAGIATWTKNMYSAAAANLQLQQQVAAGNAVMLNSVQATSMKAAAEAQAAAASVAAAQKQVARTQADIAAIQSKMALINAEKNQIMTLIHEGKATADVTMLQQRFAVSSRQAAAMQIELRNATVANATAQKTLSGAMATSTAATERAAVAAKAARASLLSLGNVANLAFAGFIGWEIGKWLTDNFETARIAGIYFVDSMMTGWYALEKLTKTIVASIVSNWSENINAIKITWAEFLEFAAKGMEVLDDVAAESMRHTAKQMREVVENELTFEDVALKIDVEFDEKMAEKGRLISQMLAEASDAYRLAEKKKKNEFIKAQEAAKKALAADLKYAESQQKLIDKLLPLQTLQREYQENLKILEDWYKRNTDKTKEYNMALANLNKEFESSKQAIVTERLRDITDQLNDEYEKRIEKEQKLQEVLFNRLELEKGAVDLAEQQGAITGAEAAAKRIEVLQKELQERQKIHDAIIGTSADATLARQEELSQIQQIRAEIVTQNEERLAGERQLQEVMMNRLELEKQAIDLAEQAGQITGPEAAAQRIEVLNQELAVRQQLHDTITATTTEATLARQEELMQIQEINAAILEQRQILADNSWIGGAKAAWKEYSQAALDAGAQAKSFFMSTFKSLEDAVMQFVETGKFEWQDFAKAVLAELLRIQVRAIMVRMLAGFAGGGGGGGTFHEGMDPSYRPPKLHGGLEPSYQPPRLHDGLKPDEFPAILQVGERVTSKKDVNAQNQQLADYERWKATGGGMGGGGMAGEGGGGVSISVPITLDPSFSKKFRSDIQGGIEDTVRKTVERYS